MTRLDALRHRARGEDGIAIATTVIIMTICMAMGLATLAYVDTQTGESRKERERDSTFNMAEAVLNAQTFILSRNWPGSAANMYPTTCTPTLTADADCPNAGSLSASYNAADYGSTATWSTRVYDNGGNAYRFYSDAAVSNPPQPRYDANQDGEVWVRAAAQVQGKSRVLVARVKVDEVAEPFPNTVVLAGKVATGNNGNKMIIDTRGNAAQATGVQLRCSNRFNAGCANCRSCNVSPNQSPQIVPDTRSDNYTGGNALSDEALDRVRERAKALGTYYTSCPANPSGALVFVEGPASCSYNNSVPGACCNSPTAPGFFIVRNGTFFINGNLSYYGVVYAANRQNSTAANVVESSGNATIYGGVIIDGDGGFQSGSSKENLVYDSFAFTKVKSYANAGIIENTWRELPGAGL